MDSNFDPFRGGCRNGQPPMSARAASLDWPGVAARLAAAHAARQILTSGPGSTTISGSFAPEVARQIARFSSPGVNQNAKAVGKPPSPIGHGSKGEAKPDIRGL